MCEMHDLNDSPSGLRGEHYRGLTVRPLDRSQRINRQIMNCN